MKTLRIFVLLLIAILCISGCSSTDTGNLVVDISNTKIFVDSETNVMYTWYKSGYGAGMSIMLNADGSPKTYKQ